MSVEGVVVERSTSSPRRLNEVADGYALRAELAELTGRTSVPAVFICGEFVGGCNDGGLGGVMTLDRRGELQPMLAKAAAKGEQ